MTEFTIGCDPELFVEDKSRKVPVSAYNLIEGTKESPFPVQGGAVQVDGLAVEFNTAPYPLGRPGNCSIINAQHWSQQVLRVKNQLNDMVRKQNQYFSLRPTPVCMFGEEFLAQQPEEARKLGCDPDFCAYTMKVNPQPDANRDFRTAAGHIHIGWGTDIPVDNPEHFEICADFVKFLDLTVGMFMTIIDKDGAQRRELYGMAGAFRPKPYGVEYRTPSNVWLTHDKRRRALYHLCNMACYLPSLERPIQDFQSPEAGRDFQAIINEGDWESAYTTLEWILSRWYGDQWLFGLVKEEYKNRKMLETRNA